jgi:hypothetical protein
MHERIRRYAAAQLSGQVTSTGGATPQGFIDPVGDELPLSLGSY